jgi:DnaJ-class molecular chaperone
MTWTEVEPGHWVSDDGHHILDKERKTGCPPCKGSGKRGSGKCRHCFGTGEQRYFDLKIRTGEIPINMHIMRMDCTQEKARQMVEEGRIKTSAAVWYEGEQG